MPTFSRNSTAEGVFWVTGFVNQPSFFNFVNSGLFVFLWGNFISQRKMCCMYCPVGTTTSNAKHQTSWSKPGFPVI